MNKLQSTPELFRHMEWADSLSWKAVFSSPVAMADSLLHQRLQHIHLVQYAFLHVWRGLQFDDDSFNFSEPADLPHWWRQYLQRGILVFEGA